MPTLRGANAQQPNSEKHALYLNTTLTKGIIIILEHKVTRVTGLSYFLHTSGYGIRTVGLLTRLQQSMMLASKHDDEPVRKRARMDRTLPGEANLLNTEEMDEIFTTPAVPEPVDDAQFNVAPAAQITLQDTSDNGAPNSFDDNFEAPLTNVG